MSNEDKNVDTSLSPEMRAVNALERIASALEDIGGALWAHDTSVAEALVDIHAKLEDDDGKGLVDTLRELLGNRA